MRVRRSGTRRQKLWRHADILAQAVGEWLRGSRIIAQSDARSVTLLTDLDSGFSLPQRFRQARALIHADRSRGPRLPFLERLFGVLISIWDQSGRSALGRDYTMASGGKMTAEARRLRDDTQRKANWKRWGNYLPERQWGTVREDYSAFGDSWNYFPHDHARSRAFRWGEDGLLGLCDRECRLCFAVALWNGRDPILKERLFGLTNPEGNHGEDVKECYYYLDATPTHSYTKALYKYPQAEYPYEWLIEENRRRGRKQREFELADTGVFDEDRYFDVFVEYAKAAPDDILIRLTVANRGPEAAGLHLLPPLW